MYLPAQDLPRSAIDLRKLNAPVPRGVKVGPSSTANTTKTQPAVKRKRRLDDDQEAGDTDMLDVPVFSKRARLDPSSSGPARNTVGVTAKRSWKLPAAQRATASRSGGSKKSWDQKVCKNR
jgi:hypothetical protein